MNSRLVTMHDSSEVNRQAEIIPFAASDLEALRRRRQVGIRRRRAARFGGGASGSGVSRRPLSAPARPAGDPLLAIARQSLARAASRPGRRRMELDDDLDRAEPQHAPQMRRQRHRRHTTRRTAAARARSACRRAAYRRSTPAAPSPAGPPSRRCSATLNSALLNGSSRLPSPLVPSGNRISASPAASRAGDAVALLRRAAHPPVDEHRALQLAPASRTAASRRPRSWR